MGQSVTSSAIVLQKRRSRLWVIGSYKMPRCDWLQHCSFLAGIEILPFALQTACKPCGFAAGRPAIVAGPVLRVAIGESCSMCRAFKGTSTKTVSEVQEKHLNFFFFFRIQYFVCNIEFEHFNASKLFIGFCDFIFYSMFHQVIMTWW